MALAAGPAHLVTWDGMDVWEWGFLGGWGGLDGWVVGWC